MYFQQIVILTFVIGVVQSSFLKLSNRIDESNIEPYITNGRNAMDGEAPWQVALQNNMNWYLCGGTILTEQWIVTAAQCISELLRDGLCTRYNTLTLSGGIVMQINQIVQHPDYDLESHENDIALIKTEGNMTLNQTNADRVKISPVPIPIGSQLNITGWGTTIFGSANFSEDLQFANLIVGDINDCNNTFGGKITSNMLCAKSIAPYNCTTAGDRGGPGVNFRRLYGIIISWDDCYMFQGYDVFTDFYQYFNWVYSVIKGLVSTTTESNKIN